MSHARAAIAFSFLTSVLASALAVSAAGCRRAAEERPLIESADIDVRVGLAGVLEEGVWNVIELRIGNRGADFDGAIEITGGQGFPEYFERGPVTHRIEAEIPGGTRREFNVPARPALWTALEVVVRQPGFSRRFVVDVPVSPAILNVLVVGDGRGVDSLRAWLRATYLDELSKSAVESVGVRMAGGRAVTPIGTPLNLVSVGPESLSPVPAAYDGFQLVFLDGVTLAGEPEAAAALERWVEGGGALVALPGVEWGGGLPARTLELLGARPGDPRATAPEPLLDLLGAAREGAVYRELLPAAGARTVGGGLAFESRRGFGAVTVFAVCPGGGRFPLAADAPAFYETLARPVERSLGFSGRARSVLGAVEGAFPQVLLGLSGFTIPSRGAVAFGLAVYLVAGFILPAIVFARRRRREWTFAVVIVAAVAATTAIYGFGLLSAREVLELEEVSVLRVHAGGERADATSFLGMMSPAFDRVELLPDPASGGGDDVSDVLVDSTQVRWPYYYGGEQVSVPRLTIEAGSGARLRLPPVTLYPNGLRTFRCDWRSSLDGLVEIREEPAGDGAAPRVAIANRSGRPMSISIVRGNRVQDRGRVTPGDVAWIPADRGESREDGWSGIQMQYVWYPGYRYNAGPQAVSLIRQAVAHPGELQRVWEMSHYGQAESGRTSGIVAALRERRPDYLVASVEESVFPASAAFRKRNAVTVIVYELP